MANRGDALPPRGRRPPAPFRRVWQEAAIPEARKRFLPDRWAKVGDVLVLRFPPELRPLQEAVCRAYCRVLRTKAVLDHQGVDGPWREPRTELLHGTGTETLHRENGIRYRLDPRRVMWSSGNGNERIRMGHVVHPGEVVVDLFAGIGYFALPMAIHGQAARVHACEANPVAHGYLVDNVRRNRAAAVAPLLGDCRDVAPAGVADRVVLGYLEGTHRFLPTALRALRPQGGWVHYHEACPDARAVDLERHLETTAADAGLAVRRRTRRRVKSYAPGVGHWVLDALTTARGTPRSRS